jgi:hypothetical protein
MERYWLNNGPVLPVQEVTLVPAHTVNPDWVWVLPVSGIVAPKMVRRAHLYATRTGAEAAREAAR